MPTSQLVRTKISIFIAGLLSLTPLSAFANAEQVEDLTLIPFEELMKQDVITASKLARQVSDAPSAVSIITAEDIHAHGYQTIADVINAMPGLYTTSDRNYEYMGGRGFGKASSDFAGRIMLLIDGYATQDGVFSQVFLGNDGLIDLDIVERVEYVPGTGAVSYGNNAMLGIINIVTKKGSDFNGTQISKSIASFGGQKERITYGKEYENGADLLLSYSSTTIAGKKLPTFHEFDSLGQAVGQNLSEPRSKDSDHNARFFAKLSQGDSSIEFAHVDRQKLMTDGYYSSNAPGLRLQTADKNSFINAKHETDIALNLKSSTRLYAGSSENRDYIDFIKSSTLIIDDTPPEEQWASRANRHSGDWFGLDQKFVSTNIKDHTIVFGTEIRNDSRQDYIRTYYYPNGTKVDTNSNQRYTHRNNRVITSFYIEDGINVSNNWQLVLGLREDKTTDGYSSSSPRVSIINNFSANTTIKASHSYGFKFPNGYESYLSNRYNYQAAPERVAASEIVVQHQLSPVSRISTTVYEYHLSNLTYDDPITGDTLTNGKSKTNGIEIDYIAKINQLGHRFSASASFQRATDVLNNRLANSPDSILKARYSFPVVNKNFRLGVEGVYFGRRFDYVGKEMPDFSIANLTLSSDRKLYGASFSFSLRNIFDKKYEVPTYLPSSSIDVNNGSGNTTYDIARADRLRTDGRTFWLQMNYDF
jgi:outer membrane receptor protein involved in Fe transport